ncbi:MAG: helix-turn-helix transcriptional regulator [Clostridia bacterium]|nr:helix-turn-helix transcriptional regulator [Clostridia bacterium]
MKFNQLIAKRTRNLLRSRNWTQYRLAQRGALPLSTLSHVLKCKSDTLTLETLLNICRGFDITLFEFFDDELFTSENISDD